MDLLNIKLGRPKFEVMQPWEGYQKGLSLAFKLSLSQVDITPCQDRTITVKKFSAEDAERRIIQPHHCTATCEIVIEGLIISAIMPGADTKHPEGTT